MERIELLRRPILRSPVGLQAWLACIAIWSARARERRALAELDERRLKDIGLSRAEADREAAKPFWRG